MTSFSDRDDESVLMLNIDRSYADGAWLLNGNYSVDN